MRSALHKIADITCIVLELAYTVISLPFKLVKAVFDIAAVVIRKAA